MNPLITEKLTEWRNSPLLFVKDCISAEPSSQQAEGLVQFAKTRRMTIRSGHGTGKDAFASWIILWFMSTRAYPRVVCTAPTARQLKDILWSELSKWIRKSRLTDEFVIQNDKMFHKDAPKEWWCRAVSPSVKASKEEQAETLAGFHADHLLIIVDEASGVTDPVFIPLEGAMTQEDNKVLLIGNMTKNSGYFYESHFHSELKKNWVTLHWDSRKSTNVMPGYVEYMQKKYGEDSDVFAIRVKGDPPREDETVLIPLSWAIQCIGNEMPISEDEPIYLGVDVARYGEDCSVILPRQGLRVFPWQIFRTMNTITLGSHVIEAMLDLNAQGIGVDEIGVGAGITDWLMKRPESGRIVHGVNVHNRSSDPEQFSSLRDELWVAMRERCMKQQYWFPGSTQAEVDMSNELCNELASLTYTFNGRGAYAIESKRQAKLRGVASPNMADALAITEYFHNIAHTLFSKTIKNRKEPKAPRPWEKARKLLSRNNWMAA